MRLSRTFVHATFKQKNKKQLAFSVQKDTFLHIVMLK